MGNLWPLIALIIPGVIFFLYISVIVFKYIKNRENNHIVRLPTMLLDPIVELVFILPWVVFRMMESSQKLFSKTTPVHQVSDVWIWREDGTKLKVRVYHPNDNNNLPMLVNFHGGGFAIGSIDTVDNSMRELCMRIGCIVVSVEYRLAPEYPYPYGFNDAYLATKWVYTNARTLRGNQDQLVVMGDSAGGNFAAGVAFQNSSNGGRDFRLAHQVLIYPSTDMRATPTRSSKKEFYYGWFYTTRHSSRFRNTYMLDYERESIQYQASPLVYEGDMSFVPGAFVLVAQLDPLRDEGTDFCQKLRDNNIPVKLHMYSATHGFFDMNMNEARRAHDDIVQVLRDLFYNNAR